MEDKFKLDYCYICGSITVFAYKGWKVLGIKRLSF